MNPLFLRAKERGVDPKTLMALEQFEADISRDPNDAFAYASMGHWWHCKSEYAKALEHYNTAIRLDPKFAYALCARADLQSTCPSQEFRNGQAAVTDAARATEIAQESGHLKRDWRHRMYLRVQAAAHAETGDYEAAIAIETGALEMAVTKSATRKITDNLATYRLQQPVRDPRGIIGYGPGRRPQDA
jgi:tetratricopeptide (TPR) repeat protein